jgi:hypothetical protein
MQAQVEKVLAAVGTTIPGEWKRLDRLIDAYVGDALKGERNTNANILANDGVVDAA